LLKTPVNFLLCKETPNGGHEWQVGGMRITVETEETQSHENAPRTHLSTGPWNDGGRSFSTKETVQQKYTPNKQGNKPYKAMETHE
jgi:hypothetical protein